MKLPFETINNLISIIDVVIVKSIISICCKLVSKYSYADDSNLKDQTLHQYSF